MKELKVREYNLDWIMENYFNTDKEVMFICDMRTVMEILLYSEYTKEDFAGSFIVEDLNNICDSFIIHKVGWQYLRVESLSINASDTIDNILILDTVLNNDKNTILNRYNAKNERVILKTSDDVENLKSLEENYSNDLQECQCDCNTCCDECCEDEKEEVFDKIYQQGVIDTIKLIAELL